MRKMSLKEVYAWVIFVCAWPFGIQKDVRRDRDEPGTWRCVFLTFRCLSTLVVYMADRSTRLRGINVRISKKESCKLILCGLLVAGQFWFFTIGMTKGAVTETTMAVRISPFIVVLFGSWFLKERIRNRSNLFWAIIFCLGGFFLMQNLEYLMKLDVPSMAWGAASALALAGKILLVAVW